MWLVWRCGFGLRLAFFLSVSKLEPSLSDSVKKRALFLHVFFFAFFFVFFFFFSLVFFT